MSKVLSDSEIEKLAKQWATKNSGWCGWDAAVKCYIAGYKACLKAQEGEDERQRTCKNTIANTGQRKGINVGGTIRYFNLQKVYCSLQAKQGQSC